MVTEITSAIARAIDKHPESLIGVAGTLLGTVGGLIGGHFLERWRSGGKVVFTPLHMHWRYDRLGKKDQPPADGTAEMAKQVDFQFEFRVLNTFPIPKSCETLSIEFFPKKIGRYSRVKPWFSDPFKMLSVTFGEDKPREVQLPPYVNTRVFCQGAGVTDIQEVQPRLNMLKNFRWVRIRFLVSPNKHVTLWYRFPESDFDPARFKPRETKVVPHPNSQNRPLFKRGDSADDDSPPVFQ